MPSPAIQTRARRIFGLAIELYFLNVEILYFHSACNQFIED